jgi:hypothetical protein
VALAAEQRRQEETEQSMCSGKKKRGEGVQGPVCKTQELQGLFGNLIFPTDIEI